MLLLPFCLPLLFFTTSFFVLRTFFLRCMSTRSLFCPHYQSSKVIHKSVQRLVSSFCSSNVLPIRASSATIGLRSPTPRLAIPYLSCFHRPTICTHQQHLQKTQLVFLLPLTPKIFYCLFFPFTRAHCLTFVSCELDITFIRISLNDLPAPSLLNNQRNARLASHTICSFFKCLVSLQFLIDYY